MWYDGMSCSWFIFHWLQTFKREGNQQCINATFLILNIQRINASIIIRFLDASVLGLKGINKTFYRPSYPHHAITDQSALQPGMTEKQSIFNRTREMPRSRNLNTPCFLGFLSTINYLIALEFFVYNHQINTKYKTDSNPADRSLWLSLHKAGHWRKIHFILEGWLYRVILFRNFRKTWCWPALYSDNSLDSWSHPWN